ncbi:AAA family ATPase [Brasilonema bromeliae]|uniref:AAA family ATPase n=1 Tax=Brasilonema bromeliae SPC951 TaxID=385972 RepID=A0ABX1P760_9CYAN|nr:AAA family ATPase [Brasilonema bromeliae]NMG19868.1 AAA family ATPase [Brasilonema bromeliae SPC951]
MTRQRSASDLWTYIAECIRLLYWIYLKPYTFANWLRDIHPELKPGTNPFAKRAEFSTNPRLRRYAGQVWWLTAVIPLVAVLIAAPIYTFVTPLVAPINGFEDSVESFNWLASGLIWLGWLIGLMIVARGDNKQKILVLIFATLTILLPFILSFTTPSSVAFVGVAFNVAVGMVLGVPFGVAFGVTFGVASSLAISVAFGVTLGVASGLAFNIVLAFGVVVLGVAFGVVCILGVLRVYFWVPELLWMLILRLLTQQKNPVLALRYLPPRFDELIRLPLPFMGEMIVKAYRENPTAARETIDYLINFTNQQQVALQAMANIAVTRLNSCQTLSDIANMTEELAWIPSPPPKELSSALPQLLDISQDVSAASQATSAHRQSELLNRPISALRLLKNSLAFGKNAEVATTFGSIIQRWQSILETAQRTLEEQGRFSKEFRQVYIAGNALDPQTAENRFKGRMDLFREIETFALSESPPVLLLYGGRRTGKTSSLKYLPDKVGASLIPLLVDLQGAASATTLQGLANNLVSQMTEAARRLPRRLDLPYTDLSRTDPFIALQNWLVQIERTLPDKRFLLCLDEYERLSEVVETTRSRVPLNFLRNILQHRTSWTLLFSGSHELSELPTYWSDYLINTRALRLTYLHESEARELIEKPVEDFPKIYEPEAVDAIIRLTRCQPYLVQLMCYEVVELLNRGIRQNKRDAATIKATVHDVETVIPTVLERGDQYFRELWTGFTEGDRNLLQRLLQGETPTKQDKASVRKLVRKEILYKEGVEFQVPLVQKYVEQRLEDET